MYTYTTTITEQSGTTLQFSRNGLCNTTPYYIYTCKAYINSSITKNQIIFIPIVKYKSKLVSGIMVYACYALSFTFINKQTILGLSKSRYTLSSKPTTHK